MILRPGGWPGVVLYLIVFSLAVMEGELCLDLRPIAD